VTPASLPVALGPDPVAVHAVRVAQKIATPRNGRLAVVMVIPVLARAWERVRPGRQRSVANTDAPGRRPGV